MKKNSFVVMKNLLKWHNWVGIILSLPIFLVALTAILLAFESELKLKDFKINKKYIPGYYFENNTSDNNYNDIKSIGMYENKIFLGTKNGLKIILNNDTSIVNETVGSEIRFIHKIADTIFFGGKYGLWSLYNGKIYKRYNKEIFDFQIINNKYIMAEGKKGIVEKNFLPVFENKLVSDSKIIDLKDLVLHIHTGRAFLGKQNEWIWINLVSLSVILLIITGVYVWIKKRLKVKQNK